MIKPTPRRKQRKMTTGARTAIATFAVLTFIGGWNLVGFVEDQKASADSPAPVVAVTATPTEAPAPTITPWPTLVAIQPLAPIPTIPLPNLIDSTAISSGLTTLDIGSADLVPIPTLAPLPALEPLPQMPTLPEPPPPPPAPAPSGGSNKSTGS